MRPIYFLNLIWALPFGAVVGTIAGLFVGGPVFGMVGYIFTASMFWQPDWLERVTGGVGMFLGALVALLSVAAFATEQTER